MRIIGRSRAQSVALLLALIALLTAACAGQSQQLNTAVSSADEASQVEYGASLREWEEVMLPESAQTESSAPVPDEAAAEAPTAGEATADTSASTIGTPFIVDDVVYREILWDGLIPADYTAEAIMTKYGAQLAAIADGSPEAAELYAKMQEEFDNAPVNEVVDGTLIRLPGFIAPLEYTGELITEFLLVPYFGACIHVPPPPANQTVLVKTAAGQGIKTEESYNPFWVMGRISAEGTTTELAVAGYSIQDAVLEPYTSQ